MPSEQAALNRLRHLLVEADELLNKGDVAQAEAKCQDAGREMKQLSSLCQSSPGLQKEAEPLFSRLKNSVDRLERLQKRSKGGIVHSPEPEVGGLAEDNPFAERNVLQAFKMQEMQLEEMRHREAAMSQLAQDMADLDAIFCKLNELTREQGEQLQLIEDHVISVEDHMIQGCDQLKDAVKNQKSSRKKKIIIICVVVAAVLLLVLILYFVISRYV